MAYDETLDEGLTETQLAAIKRVNEWEEDHDTYHLAGRLRSFIREAEDDFVTDIMSSDIEADEETETDQSPTQAKEVSEDNDD